MKRSMGETYVCNNTTIKWNLLKQIPKRCKNKNSTKMKTIFAILLYIIQLCEAYDYNCLNCEDFNRQNMMKCTDVLEKCGDCLPGFIPEETDARFCYPLEVLIAPPMLVEGVEGGAMELACEFNSKVQCVWERNGQHINIDDSHRYRFKGQGVNELSWTEDCTLTISDLKPTIDTGQWQCGSRVTSSTISVKSAIISLNIIKEEKAKKVLPFQSQVTPSTKNLEVLNSHAIHVYIDDVMVDGRLVSLERLRNQSSVVECRTEVRVEELRLELDGQSMANTFHSHMVQVKASDIEGYFSNRKRTYSKVLCAAVYAGHDDISAHLFITNAAGGLKTVNETVLAKADVGISMLSIGFIVIVIVTVCVIVVLVLMCFCYLKKSSSWNEHKTKNRVDAKEEIELKAITANKIDAVDQENSD